MSEFTWAYDAADGVYKSHELSNQLLEAAIYNLVWMPFTSLVPEFGKKAGQTVTLMHYKPLAVPSSPVLNERTRIPIDTLEMASRALTVREWGRAVQFTNLAEELSKFSPKAGAQKALRVQMQFCLDIGAADAFKDAKICFIPTSLTGGTFDTDGTPSTPATSNLTKAHLGVIRDYMANDIHVPFYEGDHYVGIFATKGLRGLKDDRIIEAWNMYLRKGDLLYKSEIGKVEEVRLIENVNGDALTNGVGTGSVLGEGVIFGDEAVSRVEAEAPELRVDPNYQGDFGRMKAAAWYGIIAFGPTWDSASDREAKIVRVTSS